MKKRKFNFSKKLLIFSITISIIGILITQFLNLTFLDRFYIYRKKIEIPYIANNVKKLKNDEEKLLEYIIEENSENGVQIILGKKMVPNYKKIKKEHYHKLKKDLPEKQVIVRTMKNGGRYLAYYDTIDGKTPLTIFIPLVAFDNYRFEVFIIQGISIFIALIISFIFANFFSKKLTKNIKKLRDASQKISNQDFIDKIGIHTNDEIEELAISIEKMSNNLKISINDLRNFVGNASHQLKTPVSVVNMISQNLESNTNLSEKEKKKLYAALIKETGEMSELINNLLFLSKISYSKNNLIKKDFILREVIQESLSKYELIELEKDLTINIDIEKDIKINTDYRFFKVVIDNLIENSFKYSPENSEINIFYKNNMLIIKNKIKNIIKEKSEELFFPFKRGSNSLNESVDGSGLGLSIIKNVLELLEIAFDLEIENDIFTFKIKI
ncbi:HAMP domain-containing sensor histidine kinase [Fusobacterium perfoetens]|uniref:HAMP domain-containing sensor histidine kinase n=1 Tax=Fusobacterium perfoetens TaxID=852 RepID=UPI0004845873|nr:HAMP domain-containing sensor histidine kinase [Fusobacterium perfoetens]